MLSTARVDPQMSASVAENSGAEPGANTAAGARRRVWLGALRHLALVDGHFSDAERHQLEEQLEQEVPGESLENLALPGDEALGHRLGVGTPIAEEFLRSAVIVALADGYLSPRELDLLRHWSQLLGVAQELVLQLESDCGDDPQPNHRLLDPLRHWLEAIEPRDEAVARLLVRLIPAQCPFERDLVVFGRKLAHIPPMCKINPVYDQLMALRFRCLCFLEGEGPAGRAGSPTSG